MAEEEAVTYLPTCLLRNADSLAVQGLMMVSEGEMKVLFLERETRLAIEALKIAFYRWGGTTYSPCSILDWKT